jgi:signal transduction histidine kinase
MTTISGFIDGILDGTIPADQQKHYLNIVSSEVKRLSRLVRSMLALSRIDSGEMKLRRADFKVKDIVIDTLLTYENLIDSRNISIEGLDLCEDVSVNGDPDLIHQVIYNLVENAVKFVNDNGTITVGIDASDQFVSVCIRNTGTGIAPDELPLIFDRFYKTDKSRNIDKNGMGLGLFIVKTIIQLHGGDITVRSTVNEFCEFEFRLPIFRESDSDSNQLS